MDAYEHALRTLGAGYQPFYFPDGDGLAWAAVEPHTAASLAATYHESPRVRAAVIIARAVKARELALAE